MTFLELQQNLTDVEYAAWIGITVPADGNFDYKLESAEINKKYDARFYLMQRFNNQRIDPHERILRQRLGLDPWIYPITSPKRKVMCMVVKEFAGDRIQYEDFKIALRNLHEYCDHYSVATLAIPRLGCDPTDGLSWDIVNAMLYEEFGQSNIRFIVCTPNEPAPTSEEFYKPIVLTSDIYPFPNPPTDSRIIHYNNPVIYGEPCPPQNRQYLPPRPMPCGPWPEYNMNPETGEMEPSNHVTTTIPHAEQRDLARVKDEPPIPEELLQYSKRCNCQHNCECGCKAQDEPVLMATPEFGNVINDPLAMHVYQVRGASSHAYPAEDILNPDIFYNPPKPLYEYPIVPNMPGTTPTYPPEGNATPEIVLEPSFPEPTGYSNPGWPETSPATIINDGTPTYAGDGITPPVVPEYKNPIPYTTPDIDQEPIMPQCGWNMHGPGDPLSLFESPPCSQGR